MLLTTDRTDSHRLRSSVTAQDLRVRDPRTYALIGAAMEVHTVLGPGFLEAVYQEALEIELDQRHIPFVAKRPVKIDYKAKRLEAHYIPDFVAFETVVMEIKAQRALGRADAAQLINSLRCCRFRTGLLVNFGEPSLGWKRFVL